jgi:hypothetical protein
LVLDGFGLQQFAAVEALLDNARELVGAAAARTDSECESIDWRYRPS